MKILTNKSIFLQVFPFALFCCIDGFASVSLIWILLDKYNSLVSLGISLSISSLLSFFIQKKSTIIKEKIFSNVNKFFIAQSSIVLVFSILNLFFIDKIDSKEFIMVSLIFFSLFIFMNYFFVDSVISKFVLNKNLTSAKGSIVSQLVMQFGAIIGFSTGGYIFNLYKLKGSIVSIIIILVICIIFSIFKFKLNFREISINSSIKNHTNNLNAANNLNNYTWLSAFCILMISFQLANFNLFLPDIFLKSKFWTADNFGLVAGIASLGAFLASFIVFKEKNFILKISLIAFIIPLANIILVKSGSLSFCVLSSFFLGFSVNSLRSTFRKKIFDNLNSQNDVTKWMSISNLFTFLPRAIFPLFVTLFINANLSTFLYPLIGFTVALFIIIFSLLMNQKSEIKILDKVGE